MGLHSKCVPTLIKCLTHSPSFEPSIVQTFGFSAVRTQLMSVPPFAVSFVGESVSDVIFQPSKISSFIGWGVVRMYRRLV